MKKLIVLCVAFFATAVLLSGCERQDLPEEHKLPSDELIEKYRELSSHFGELEIFEENGKYYAQKPSATVEIEGTTYSMKIDLGGIGKGYTADAVNALLDERGYTYGYFNFGSSSMVCKKHLKNGNYTVGFLNPRPVQYGEYYVSVPVADDVISTSGDYEQYFEKDGVRYCHVFNPMTGKPVQTDIMTATIIGGSAAENDALTTAVMAMGTQRAKEFIKDKLSDRRVLFSYGADGKYRFATNIAEGGYEINSSSFERDEIIEGATYTLQEVDKVEDTEGYSSFQKVYYNAMNTQAVLTVTDIFETDEQKDRAEKLGEQTEIVISEIEKSISSHLAESYIFKFNEAEAGTKVEINKIAYEVLSISKSVYELTDGYYNPAVYYSVQAYGFNKGLN